MKRTLGTIALVVWMTLLVLAAWPTLVRPGFLDGANEVAVGALRLFGMSAGQPLFPTEASPWKQHAFCFYLRDPDAPRGAELLFPPGGDCRILGFHARLPPVYRATHRSLATAWKLRQEPDESNALLSAVGRAFCLAGDDPTARPARLQGAWVWYYSHYETGQVLRRNGLVFDYACDPAALDGVAWEPRDEEVLARWEEVPW